MIAQTAQDQLFVNEATHLVLEHEVPRRWIGEPTETIGEAVNDLSEEVETTSMTEINEDRSLEGEAKELI